MKEDYLRRFLFADLGVRGEWVQLSDSWQAAKQHQQHSPAMESLLGQALAAVVLLSATIKFQGSIILQAQGDGAIKTLVTQASSQRTIRGLLRCEPVVADAPLCDQFGNGRLVLTVASETGEPYQGIIGLEGATLALTLENYFQQSEQLNTRLWLFANGTHAAGLLLQQLPTKSPNALDWQHIEILANTLTEQELLTLECETLLYRLFNQENVHLFAAEPVSFECACSKARIERTLRALGAQELEAILQQCGVIDIVCEFCSAPYVFNSAEVAQLLANEPVQTVH